MASVYILRCHDKTFYTGWAIDLKKRVARHQAGKAAKYTRSRLPVQLVYVEEFSTPAAAMKREYAIKQLSKAEKAVLVSSREPL